MQAGEEEEQRVPAPEELVLGKVTQAAAVQPGEALQFAGCGVAGFGCARGPREALT